jgi:hypothetical protein
MSLRFPLVSLTREQLLSGVYDTIRGVEVMQRREAQAWADGAITVDDEVPEKLAKQDKEEAKKSKEVYDSAPQNIKDLFDLVKTKRKTVDSKYAEANRILKQTKSLDVNSPEWERLDSRRFELYAEITVIVHEIDALRAALENANYEYYGDNLLHGV